MVEHVDVGKLLEQACLAFHHRLARQRTDVAQTQNGRAVGHDRHQIAARGQRVGLRGIGRDRVARHRHSWRISPARRSRCVAIGLVGTTEIFPWVGCL